MTPNMQRRDFLWSAGISSGGFAFPPKARCLFAEDAARRGWRTFKVTTRVEVLRPSGATPVWLPAACIEETPFQKTLANKFNAEGGSAHIVEKRADGLGIVAATFPAGVKPVLTLTNRISTKDYGRGA